VQDSGLHPVQLYVMPDVPHLVSGVGIFNIQPSDAQEYCQDEHTDHESGLGVKIDINPAPDEQEQERSYNKDGTPCAQHKQLVEIVYTDSSFFNLFHGRYLLPFSVYVFRNICSAFITFSSSSLSLLR
jgi:hypothetical protein